MMTRLSEAPVPFAKAMLRFRMSSVPAENSRSFVLAPVRAPSEVAYVPMATSAPWPEKSSTLLAV